MISANSLSHVKIGILPSLARHYILRCSIAGGNSLASDATPVIDIHIHIQPLHAYKPHALALIQKGRRDYPEVERYSADAKLFLNFLDEAGIERAGLINYVSPEVIGFPPEVNDWITSYCCADPARLLAFGSVHPKYVPDAGAEVDRLAHLGIRGLKVHPSH